MNMNIKADDSKFTWGDSVIIRKNSPTKFHPGEFASVCGFYKVQSKETATELACKMGDWVYTVEFGDGSNIEVPECYLDKDFSVLRGEELSKYGSYFVNGTVLEVVLSMDIIKIKLKSSFVHQQISENPLFLKNGYFTGTLIATRIIKFVMENSDYPIKRQQIGNILSFEISDQALKLHIEWEKNKTTSLKIQASQFWWEQELTDE